MRRRRAKEQMQLNAEINVVSLIDVMMLLLVIFMLTAPMMTGGMDINLPEADAKPIEAAGGMTVSIDRNGKIFLDDIELSLDRFKTAFASRAKRSTQKSVKFAIDGDVRWELQSQVLAAINAAGITAVGYVFNPITEPAR